MMKALFQIFYFQLTTCRVGRLDDRGAEMRNFHIRHYLFHISQFPLVLLLWMIIFPYHSRLKLTNGTDYLCFAVI